jgi:hypothetical protein
MSFTSLDNIYLAARLNPIMKVFFFVLFSAALLLCFTGCSESKNPYNDGYVEGFKNGKTEGFAEGEKAGYKKKSEEKFSEGYLKGYADGKSGVASAIETETIDSLLFASSATRIMIWVFSILNILVISLVLIFLVMDESDPAVITSKILLGISSAYFWFRVTEPFLVASTSSFAEHISSFGSALFELASFIVAVVICALIDFIYFRSKIRQVWLDAIGVMVCVPFIFSYLHILINWKVLSSYAGGPALFLHITGAFSVGAMVYIALRTIRDYTREKGQASLYETRN